ncbi:MAG: divergent polysaccharide deacetylase family protein [Nitrospinota bacterium]|nr:MAG: divergent polysaccharide deacetylase family protein [Nitrospinota bacterium]
MRNGNKPLGIICAVLLAFLGTLLLILLYRSGEEPSSVQLSPPSLTVPGQEETRQTAGKPLEEEWSFKDPIIFPPLPEAIDSFQPPQAGSKRLAILIDDLGWNLAMARRLLQIDAPLTFAILPGLPYSQTVAEEAHARQREILLHLPMEPHGYPQIDPGAGALFSSMSEEELEAMVRKNLTLVPYIKGVNNHMGSKLTEQGWAMEVVCRVLKEQNLFFVDSMTSPKSVAYTTAHRIGLRTAYRHIFFDHEQREEVIRQQVRKLATLAQKNGGAIGIGHPHPETIRVLEEMIPQLQKEGFTVVPVSQLLH